MPSDTLSRRTRGETKMRVGAGLVPVLVLVGSLTACAQAGEKEVEGGSARASASGGTVGAAGSACELPVGFDIAQSWEAEAIDSGAVGSNEVAEALLRQGPVTAACEIDAKPAGHIGFLRVYTGDPSDSDARTALAGFITARGKVSEEKYTAFKSGDLTGSEVEYLCTSELLDETKKERALAVTTPDGVVVLHLGGMDTEEHEAMLPAYELAKRTLRVV